MFRSVAMRALLALALATSTSASVAAQADPAPEGPEWQLAAYVVDGAEARVPWNVDATLSLEAGQARGSGGCNDFGSRYELDGDALTFQPPDSTDVGCAAAVMELETAYLAALPEVVSWAIDSGTGGYRGLYLYDVAGDIVLTFEEPSISLTPSDISSLTLLLEDQQAQIDRLGERLDSVRIGTLRDRVKALEDAVQRLTTAAARSGSTVSAAERTLLRGVPTRIRSTCRPLRGSGLPAGTLAAVRCDAGAGVVSEMAYYLLPYPAAERTFTTLLTDEGAPERFSCPEGRAGQALLSPYHATGCFVDVGRANVRLIAWAADCHELDVAGRRVQEPAIYVALEGSRGRIRPLYEWATNPDEPVLGPVWKGIPHGGTPRSPACRGL